MTKLTFEQLKSICPTGSKSILEDTVTAFNEHSEQFGLITPLRKSHFIAQIAHESAHFRTTVEYGGKNARYAPWYGRGLIQCTWEENYRRFYEWCKRGGLNPPNFLSVKGREEVAKFPWAFLSAVWYWEWKKLNSYADKDDIRTITKLINGGYNGMADREKYLTLSKKVFMPAVKDFEFSPKRVQLALIAKGFNIGSADGIIGPKTTAGIRMFQIKVGLPATGKVDERTYRELVK